MGTTTVRPLGGSHRIGALMVISTDSQASLPTPFDTTTVGRYDPQSARATVPVICHVYGSSGSTRLSVSPGGSGSRVVTVGASHPTVRNVVPISVSIAPVIGGISQPSTPGRTTTSTARSTVSLP